MITHQKRDQTKTLTSLITGRKQKIAEAGTGMIELKKL